MSVFFGAGLAFRALAALDRRDYGGALLRSPAGALLRARDGARECLEDWCWVRGDGPGPLFPPVDGSGSVARGRPSVAGLEATVRGRMASAGLADLDPGELADSYRSPWWSEEPAGGSDR